MKLIINTDTKLVLEFANDFKEVGQNIESQSRCIAFDKRHVEVIEIDSIPQDVVRGEYKYIDGEFIKQLQDVDRIEALENAILAIMGV